MGILEIGGLVLLLLIGAALVVTAAMVYLSAIRGGRTVAVALAAGLTMLLGGRKFLGH